MAKEHLQGINEEIIVNEDDDETDAADESLSLPPSIEKALDEAEKRLLEAKSRASHDFVKALSDSIEVNGHGKMQAQALQMFRDVQAAPALCPLGAAMMDAAPGKEQSKPTRDPRTWEVISAVVDSGATIAALNPKTGRGYPVEESTASKNGVEYEVADGGSLLNLGQKRLAVITAEGSLRGYQSEVANVTSPLQSVRRLLAASHCVLFGLGPTGEDHLIINKISGEVNRMRDDGTNYLQDLLVVPPEFLEDVAMQMNGVEAAGDPCSPFHRQG